MIPPRLVLCALLVAAVGCALPGALRERLFAVTPGEVLEASDGRFSVTVPGDSLYVRRNWPRDGSLALYPTRAVSVQQGPYVVVRWARTEVEATGDLCGTARAMLHEPVAETPGYAVLGIEAREDVWRGIASCELEFFVSGPARGERTGSFHYVGRFVSQGSAFLWLGHGKPVAPEAPEREHPAVAATRTEFEAFAAGVVLEPAPRW